MIYQGGMIESRQDVIDIEDCEYGVFKGKQGELLV